MRLCYIELVSASAYSRHCQREGFYNSVMFCGFLGYVKHCHITLLFDSYSMHIVFCLYVLLFQFSAILIVCNALECFILLCYKSASAFYVLFDSGYYHTSFIAFRFPNVCVTFQLSFYNYLLCSVSVSTSQKRLLP